MSDEEFQTMIDAVKALADSINNLAHDLATSAAPTDTGRLIEAVADLSQVVERAESKGVENFPGTARSDDAGQANGHY